jgi:hypothetical protein
MSEMVPLAVFAVLVVVLVAMPWRRPHPDHEFVLELLRSRLRNEQDVSTVREGNLGEIMIPVNGGDLLIFVATPERRGPWPGVVKFERNRLVYNN